ncbi:MAG: hypothetical protein F6K04_11870 [Leptolyngbya sp. SIO4C5]|uniref:hypothetical protein n=1 Tax=Sphaerothrix gracilis TaxID=3151835 RepID=UPI0013C04531|nr:hypothetical protein [Leptolyngbya sp. SIO4C5]
MELLVGLLSAAIAATVSVLIALISFVANRNALKSERDRFERELERNMTTKLYSARLEVYPEAIAITDGLRKSRIAAQADPQRPEYFNDLLLKLDQWHSTKAFLLLSRNAVQTLYRLRRVLREKPAKDGKYAKEQIDRIWQAKGAFRSALRADIQLLYREEADILQDD